MRKERTCWSIADLTSIHAALSQISAGTCAFCTEGESHNNKSAAPNGSGCAHSCIKHAYDTTEQERRNEKLKVQHSSPPPRSAVHAHTKRQKTHPLICFKGAITRYLLSPFKESLKVFCINRIPKVMIQFCYSLRRHLGIESAFCRPCNE